MITKYQLKNGLTVLFVCNSKAPVVSVQMWVRTGSRDEQKGEEGLSHFIEHLVFKGTDQYKVGEIAQAVEGAGGELNAYTSFDQTVFYVTIASRYAHVAMDVISQMMGYPKFDAREIGREREVVIEEIKRGEDSLGRRASQLLFKTAYQTSNYRKPVIGFAENIRKVSPRKIQDYFHRRYHPQNMFLVVTGDLEPKNAKKMITEYFSKIPKRKLTNIKHPKEPKQTRPRIKVEKTSFDQSIAYFAWHIPNSNHKDIAALDVATFILGQGESSRLYHRLRLENPLVKSISMGNYLPIEKGLTMCSMSFEPREFSKALSVFAEELATFATSGPSSIEVERAKLNIQSGEFFGMETVDGLARKFGSAEFQFRNPKAFDLYFKQLAKVTPRDVQRVIQKYLVPEGLCVAIVSPEPATQSRKWGTQFAKEWRKHYQQAIQNQIKASGFAGKKPAQLKLTSPSNKKSDAEIVELKNGVRVIFKEAHGSPVLSCRVATLGGSRLETVPGVAELMGRTWLSGSRHKTEKELSEALDDLGGQLSPVIGRNTTGLSLDVLPTKETFGRELFFEVLCAPVFDEAIVSREKLFQIDQIKKKNDNPTQVAFQAFNELMYNGHPFANDSLGTESSLQSIGHKEVLHNWSKDIRPEKMVFALCGPVDRKNWLAAIEKHFSAKKSHDGKIASLELSPLKQSLTKHITLKKEQSHIVLGHRSFALTDTERHALQVMQAILAGQGGRLFIELRDKESLAYSVSPIRAEGIEKGYFGAYIGCSPEKTAKAIEMLRTEFRKLCEDPIGRDELVRAQNYLIGRHEIELQRLSTVSASLLYDCIYGLAVDETYRYGDKINAVSSEQVMTVAKKIFTGPEVLVSVGPG